MSNSISYDLLVYYFIVCNMLLYVVQDKGVSDGYINIKRIGTGWQFFAG